MADRLLPTIIQGGMGVAVSDWRLANAVARRGQLGVISGTAIDVVHTRRLADGDPDGILREAYEHFPVPHVARKVYETWHRPGGREPGTPYPKVEMPTVDPTPDRVALTVVANFAEVWLARKGHDGPVGVNFLEKIRVPSLPELLGAVLGEADFVIMGAGIPTEIPGSLTTLAAGKTALRTILVEGGDDLEIAFDPTTVVPDGWPRRRPEFLAIVSSNTLATYLARSPSFRPDGFIVELPIAGGHNAPPRNKNDRDETGQPVYGPRDTVDLAKLAELGLPYWLAGGFAGPDRLAEARAQGAVGIQAGSAFALCDDSGLDPGLRARLVAEALAGELVVRTDPVASPSGYPFKVAQLGGTIADPEQYAQRRRVCDLGYLRNAYATADGGIDYRCPAEPADAFLRKGGEPAELEGRICLCNGLMSAAGFPQLRRGEPEPALSTLGDDAIRVARILAAEQGRFSADDVLDWILGGRVDEPMSR